MNKEDVEQMRQAQNARYEKTGMLPTIGISAGPHGGLSMENMGKAFEKEYNDFGLPWGGITLYNENGQVIKRGEEAEQAPAEAVQAPVIASDEGTQKEEEKPADSIVYQSPLVQAMPEVFCSVIQRAYEEMVYTADAKDSQRNDSAREVYNALMGPLAHDIKVIILHMAGK